MGGRFLSTTTTPTVPPAVVGDVAPTVGDVAVAGAAAAVVVVIGSTSPCAARAPCWCARPAGKSFEAARTRCTRGGDCTVATLAGIHSDTCGAPPPAVCSNVTCPAWGVTCSTWCETPCARAYTWRVVGEVGSAVAYTGGGCCWSNEAVTTGTVMGRGAECSLGGVMPRWEAGVLAPMPIARVAWDGVRHTSDRLSGNEGGHRRGMRAAATDVWGAGGDANPRRGARRGVLVDEGTPGGGDALPARRWVIASLHISSARCKSASSAAASSVCSAANVPPGAPWSSWATVACAS